MKIRTKRGTEETEETNFLVVYIGGSRFQIEETNQGRMCINKVSDSDTDEISVFPNVKNQIEIK